MDSVPDLAQELMKDSEFLLDLCRYSENLLTEKFIRKKYHLLSEDVWQKLGEDESLIEKVEAEKLRRIRDGSSKREKAQQHIAKAPDVLNDIMLDAGANPRHKIDAAKALDDFAEHRPQTTPAAVAAERFCITINLGADVPPLVFNKSIALGPKADDSNSAPQKLLPTNKQEHDSNNNIDDANQVRPPWGLMIATSKQGNDDNGGQSI
jgi:hypothetical protein